jgi:hypothetical protein
MLYECDDTNCNVGKPWCTNRAFAELAERKAKGGPYRTGVEVYKTSDRGYGVRSNRCFEPNQIITEYTGEIITEEECDRRMNEEYKNNAVGPPGNGHVTPFLVSPSRHDRYGRATDSQSHIATPANLRPRHINMILGANVVSVLLPDVV